MKITSYEQACKKLKLNPKNLPVVSKLPKRFQKSIIAGFKLKIIIEAINDGWSPNLKDSNQCKYFPYFYMNDNGRFCYVDGSCISYDYACLESGLYYKDPESAIYGGKKFVKLYKEFMIK